MSLAPSVSREKEASCGLLGLIRERLASEGVDLNNLGLSPLKMAGAQTGQALLELVRRAVSDSNPSPHPKEDAPALPSPPQREDFAAAGLAWDKLQRESAFWRTLKVSPALSSWRKGFSPEELDAIFAGLESLALEKMEREHALANKLHPRFLLASDPARAEERRLIQEKAEKILAGRANSLTLFPSLDAEALPLQGPVLASVCHVAGANPENSENNADRALLFLEANGKTPLGYLDLGPAPASLKRVLGAIGRFSRERDRVKVLLAGAEYFDGRKKLMVKETPVSQKDGWMESFLRARLAAGSSPLKGGAPIALPARSGEWGRLVAFYSPGVGKERQTALRETLSRILKEQKRFWGEKADEKARAFFQATVRRHRRRTGLKVLGSLFEESRAPGGELVWKIAAEKRALAESVFDFTVLRAAVSAKVIGDAELRRLYRRRQEISREIASLAGPRDFNLELWLKFFGESWRASPASAREKAPRGENAPRAEAAFQEESAPDGKGGPVGAPLGPPREDFPAGSFLWERLYELLASQKAREERPPLASLAEPSKPTP
ncbi:MAG: hypothetical protein LBO66_05130 [Deltaproteobacteria bacterium]|nr:hypothetical protein [Deltaproteobacteria bacterium]